jgi:hypothetical protein
VEKKDELVADVLDYFGMTSGSKILLVDDDNRFNNENLVTDALDLTGLPYSVFDCGNSDGMATDIPSLDTLQQYELVIWFAGDDGKLDALWNAADEDNQAIKDYLDIGEKNLWVIGSDWLYDRYSGAPDVFQAGDMVYDYSVAPYIHAVEDVWRAPDLGNMARVTILPILGLSGLGMPIIDSRARQDIGTDVEHLKEGSWEIGTGVVNLPKTIMEYESVKVVGGAANDIDLMPIPATWKESIEGSAGTYIHRMNTL